METSSSYTTYDFFKELNDLIDQDQDQDIDNLNNLCLIEKQPLRENFIVLNCGHTFNYLSIYNEIIHQKTSVNAFKSKAGHKYYTPPSKIKCPYCRTLNPLLPFISDPNVKLTKNVNKLYNTTKQCSYICKDSEGLEFKCINGSTTLYKKQYYCVYHKKIVSSE